MIILYASRLTYMYNILQRFEMMAILTNDYPSKQQLCSLCSEKRIWSMSYKEHCFKLQTSLNCIIPAWNAWTEQNVMKAKFFILGTYV